MNTPIRMKYKGDLIVNTVYMDVDVYQFFLKTDGSCSALCWFIKDKEWLVVDVEMLIPGTIKPLLNE